MGLAGPGFTAIWESGALPERFTWEAVRMRLLRAPSRLLPDVFAVIALTDDP